MLGEEYWWGCGVEMEMELGKGWVEGCAGVMSSLFFCVSKMVLSTVDIIEIQGLDVGLFDCFDDTFELPRIN